jgi:putative ABC transport system permease protein
MARQLVLEHLLLGAAAGTAAWWITRGCMLTRASATASRYLANDYAVNTGTLFYLLGTTVAAAMSVAFVPVAWVGRLDVSGAVRGAAQYFTGKRLAPALLASQMALALVLLLGAGVLVRSFENIVHGDTGVPDPDHVVVGWLRLPSSTYPTADARLAFYDRLDAEVRAIPGVDSAAFAVTFPTRSVNRAEFELEGKPRVPGNEQFTQLLPAGADYLHVMGVSPLAGRTFNEQDDRSMPLIAIVNQSFVDAFSPKAYPIGRRFRNITRTPGPWRTIVGLVPNIMQGDPTRQSFMPVVYVPVRQAPSAAAFLFARTNRPSEQAASAIRAAARRLDPDVIGEDFSSLTARFAFDRDYMDLEHAELGKHAAVAPVFASIALLLSAVGLFAVVAQSVTQRTKEIGIRMALGAAGADVRRMVLREAMMPVLIGLCAGLAASLAVNRVLQSQLVGVSPYDPVTMVGAPLVLIVVACVACQIPVRRAMNVNPGIALRHD